MKEFNSNNSLLNKPYKKVVGTDFDGTVIPFETPIKLFVFILRKDPRLIKYLGVFLKNFAKYKNGNLSKEQMIMQSTSISIDLLNRFSYSEQKEIVEEFWDINRKYLNPYFKDVDYVITSSPRAILEPIFDFFDHAVFICTEFCFDEKGELIIDLCYRGNKVEKALDYGINHFDIFYSDSLNDFPVFTMSSERYLVSNKKGRPLEVNAIDESMYTDMVLKYYKKSAKTKHKQEKSRR